MTNPYYIDLGSHTITIIYLEGVPVRYEAWRRAVRDERGRTTTPAAMLDGFSTLDEAAAAVKRDRGEPATTGSGQAPLL